MPHSASFAPFLCPFRLFFASIRFAANLCGAKFAEFQRFFWFCTRGVLVAGLCPAYEFCLLALFAFLSALRTKSTKLADVWRKKFFADILREGICPQNSSKRKNNGKNARKILFRRFGGRNLARQILCRSFAGTNLLQRIHPRKKIMAKMCAKSFPAVLGEGICRTFDFDRLNQQGFVITIKK